MKAPFPWFGGKRRVAPEIWAAFGDADNYVEPFAGSLAVLLERPTRHDGIATGAETVNDSDRYLANLYRAIIAAPDEVAKHADWPVNEVDLTARHLWLVNEGRARIARLEADPDAFDAKVAGWWLWGCCAWIGSGWCSGDGPWLAGPDGLVRRDDLGDAGQGVNRQIPHLGPGRGVNRQLPHLGSAGQGAVNGFDMEGGGSGLPPATWDRSLWRDGEPLVYGYMRALQARLRRVRVCCGDWSRVVTDAALAFGATVGILLDPPYDTDSGASDHYVGSTRNVSAEVRAWALEAGRSKRLRIALCGYAGSHEMPGWREHRWKATGAYLGRSAGQGAENRLRERIWFSPGCLAPAQPDLFAARTA